MRIPCAGGDSSIRQEITWLMIVVLGKSQRSLLVSSASFESRALGLRPVSWSGSVCGVASADSCLACGGDEVLKMRNFNTKTMCCHLHILHTPLLCSALSLPQASQCYDLDYDVGATESLQRFRAGLQVRAAWWVRSPT